MVGLRGTGGVSRARARVVVDVDVSMLCSGSRLSTRGIVSAGDTRRCQRCCCINTGMWSLTFPRIPSPGFLRLPLGRHTPRSPSAPNSRIDQSRIRSLTIPGVPSSCSFRRLRCLRRKRGPCSGMKSASVRGRLLFIVPDAVRRRCVLAPFPVSSDAWSAVLPPVRNPSVSVVDSPSSTVSNWNRFWVSTRRNLSGAVRARGPRACCHSASSARWSARRTPPIRTREGAIGVKSAEISSSCGRVRSRTDPAVGGPLVTGSAPRPPPWMCISPRGSTTSSFSTGLTRPVVIQHGGVGSGPFSTSCSSSGRSPWRIRSNTDSQ